MTAKKPSRSKKSGQLDSGSGRSGPSKSRVAAAPSPLYEGTLPTLELRSPLLGPAPSPTEELLFDLKQLTGSRTYDSLDELNRELGRLTTQGAIPRSDPAEPRPKAQRLVYEAWADAGRGVLLANKALALDPDCVDAYLFLAVTNADRPQKALELALQALEAGERCLQADADSTQAEGHLWSYLPARPYLRARTFLAQYLWGLGGRLAAVELAAENLTLDENDALGVRYLLLSWYLDMGEEMMTQELLRRYRSERSTILLFADALVTFWSRGGDRTAKAHLTKALKANPHVPERLLSNPPDPLQVLDIGSYAPGSEEEADICAFLLLPAWERDREAVDWLEETSGGVKLAAD